MSLVIRQNDSVVTIECLLSKDTQKYILTRSPELLKLQPKNVKKTVLKIFDSVEKTLRTAFSNIDRTQMSLCEIVFNCEYKVSRNSYWYKTSDAKICFLLIKRFKKEIEAFAKSTTGSVNLVCLPCGGSPKLFEELNHPNLSNLRIFSANIDYLKENFPLVLKLGRRKQSFIDRNQKVCVHAAVKYLMGVFPDFQRVIYEKFEEDLERVENEKVEEMTNHVLMNSEFENDVKRSWEMYTDSFVAVLGCIFAQVEKNKTTLAVKKKKFGSEDEPKCQRAKVKLNSVANKFTYVLRHSYDHDVLDKPVVQMDDRDKKIVLEFLNDYSEMKFIYYDRFKPVNRSVKPKKLLFWDTIPPNARTHRWLLCRSDFGDFFGGVLLPIKTDTNPPKEREFFHEFREAVQLFFQKFQGGADGKGGYQFMIVFSNEEIEYAKKSRYLQNYVQRFFPRDVKVKIEKK